MTSYYDNVARSEDLSPVSASTPPPPPTPSGETAGLLDETNFWDVGQYKRTVRRIEDGHRLASEYAAFVQERGALEEAYAKGLRTWAKKWAEKMDRGPEYGSMQAGWKAPLDEAEKVAQIHLNIRDRLANEVVRHMKDWQKENFHKPLVPMNQIKEAKEMDETFRKTQKPWAKLYKKVLETKKIYHLTCKYERTAVNQEANARADTSKSPEEQKRLREKVDRCKEDVSKARERYQACLQDLNGCNAKYMEDMKEVFEKCQRMEESRMTFFKGILLNFQKGLDITQYDELPKVYDDLRAAIDRIDISKDLTAFSNTHGVGMPMNWPVFEEYSPEFHSISSKKVGKGGGSVDSDGVTLTGIVQREAVDVGLTQKRAQPNSSSNNSHYNLAQQPPQQQYYTNDRHNSNNSATTKSNYGYYEAGQAYNATNNHHNHHHLNNNNNSSVRSSSDDTTSSITTGPALAHKPTPTNVPRSPFERDDSDGGVGADPEHHHSSISPVPVRALYDYEGQESDELSFKKDDEFEKLEDEDEQGWCKGRIGSRIGLYPAEYADVI